MRLSWTGIRVSFRLEKSLAPLPLANWVARSLGIDMEHQISQNEPLRSPSAFNGVIKRPEWPYQAQFGADRGRNAIHPLVLCLLGF
jgi:hypothetical protein